MIVYLTQNAINYTTDKEEKHFTFKNKLSSLILQHLYNKSLIHESLTFAEVESLVKLNNPTFILQRTHISRVLAELNQAISELSLPIQIQYEKRNKTVGPWYLLIEGNVEFIYENKQKISNQIQNRFFIFPPDSHDSQVFYLFIKQWFKSYSCYYLGLLDDALNELSLCYQHPINLFLKSVLDLYKSKLLTLKGELDLAEQIVQDIINNSHICNTSHIKEQAYILQARIMYMRKPISNYEQLLTLDLQPKKYSQENPVSLMEWHNLQSLLLKRKLLRYKNFIKVKELHQLVIYHLQEAIVSAFILENNIRILDFCCNYALYLQSICPMRLATISQTLEWHQLSANISNKLGIGDYSIWQDIFYAEFYVQNYKSFTEKERKSIASSKERFYLAVIEKFTYYPNHHLKVIFYLCYFKFLKISKKDKSLNEVADKIILLLNSDSTLYPKLITDGYQKDIQEVCEYSFYELLP